MTDLNDFNYTDGIHDVLAAYINQLVAGNLRGELCNTQTLSADLTLTNASFPTQNLTASGANRNALLPVAAAANHVFVFRNAGASNNIVVKDSTGTTTFATLTPGQAKIVTPIGGTTWAVIG